jgi:hypothetical protein
MSKLYLSLTLTLLLAVSSSTISAQNCKGVKEKKDPFTNEVVRKASINIDFNNQIILQRAGDVFYVGLDMYQTGLMDEKLLENEKILFKLESGEVVELVLDKDYPAIRKVGYNTTGTSWSVLLKVEKSDFKKFSKSPITAIRLSIHGTDKLIEVGSRGGGKIMETLTCLLQD